MRSTHLATCAPFELQVPAGQPRRHSVSYTPRPQKRRAEQTSCAGPAPRCSDKGPWRAIFEKVMQESTKNAPGGSQPELDRRRPTLDKG